MDMDKEKLFDTIDGLFAYDTGSIDSGIKNESLKEEIKTYLINLTDDEFRILTSEYIREYFVSEEAVNRRYGIADVKEFIDWLSWGMGISI